MTALTPPISPLRLVGSRILHFPWRRRTRRAVGTDWLSRARAFQHQVIIEMMRES